MGVIKSVVTFVLLGLAASALAGPDIQTWKLDNGTKVLFVPARDLPMVQLSLVFDAGSARDPEHRSGLAGFVAGMLEEGAAGLTANQVADGFESLGAEFSAGVDNDMAMINLRSLADSDYLDPAIELMQKLVTRPDFPEASLARERARAIVGFARARQQPDYIGKIRFFDAMYGKHPYAHQTEGDEASVKTIAVDDLKQFHKQFYVGNNAVLAIVGDLSGKAARTLANRLAGTLPAGNSATDIPKVSLPAASYKKHIPFQSTQTHIFIGQPGMSRTDPDYFSLYVGNYILGGGGFVSRLMDQVREKQGLAYSVYSYFWPLREPGPFQIGMQTKNSERDKALALLDRILRDFVKNGPTDAELKAAKQNLTGGFPMRIDSNKKISGYLAVIGFYDLPLDYIDRFIGNVEAVTVESIRDAFRRRVHPDKMVTITVGG
ncbi:MAG: insulinase family protein [Gammaproteobacteria bacterium]|nr:insulinase family protein [Gammaproteobacteria bacterium]